MRRAGWFAGLSFLTLTLPGCPFDDGDSGCKKDSECAEGLRCELKTGVCTRSAAPCERPEDCGGTNETCTPDGWCAIGSCHLLGCVDGYDCRAVESIWTCTEAGTGGAAGSAGGGGELGDAGSGGQAGAADSEGGAAGTAGSD